MDWKTLNGFDEKYSKISSKQHKTFGGKVVEVLYGATDAEGNPVTPREGVDDGKGRWYGIEVDGEYRMFSLQHPASEGGAVEYTTEHGDHAVEDMEDDIRRRQEICREAEAAKRSNDEDAAEKIEKLREEWDQIEDWGTSVEKEHIEHFNRIIDELDSIKEMNEANKTEKEAIVKQAEELSESTSWRQTNEAFRKLQDAWREIGSAGKDDDSLWNQFNSFRKAFNEKRRDYFANLEVRNAENKEKKENLIAEAKAAAENVKNWKIAGDAMNGLMDAWKAVQSAGREADEALWAEFNEIRRDFFARRKEFFEERDAQRKESIEKKTALIEEAKKIAETGDFSKEATDRMKELDKEWKGAGYSGKNDNDRLWDEFTVAKDVFWNGKRSENQKRFQEIIDRKQSVIANMKDQINDLEIKTYETDDYTTIRGYNRRIEEKKNIIANMEEDIEDLKKKLD